ncbi:MAG: dUTP diphosphatase [Pseudomonadota bacterium]
MSSPITVRVKRIRPERDSDIPLPRYMTTNSSGMDLCAAIDDQTALMPGEICLVPTGLAVSIPPGYEFQIRPRSGLAVTYGISVINAPGTIDSDYRGEICVALVNFGKERFVIRRGERIAQMVLSQVQAAKLELVEELDSTEREAGGFGHTGVKSEK